MSPPLDLERLAKPLARLLRVPLSDLPACFAPAREGDLPSLLELRRQVIGEEITWDDDAYLRWRFQLGDEPVVPGAPVGRLWSFKRGDELLGCLGAEELTVETASRSLRAYRFLDLMVQPAVNGMGLGAWLNLMLLRRVDVGLSPGGSAQSATLIDKLFRRMPDRKVWVLPLRVGPLLAQRWSFARGLLPLSVGLDLALAARRQLARLGRGGELEVSPTADPDPAVDELSRTMAASGLVMVPRTAAFWRWRFQLCTRRHYGFRVVRRHGRVVAAGVWRRYADVADVVDFLWDASQPEALCRAALLRLFVSIADEGWLRGATKLRVMTYEPFGQSLCQALGMVHRPYQLPFAIYASGPALESELVGARWFITFADTDGD